MKRKRALLYAIMITFTSSCFGFMHENVYGIEGVAPVFEAECEDLEINGGIIETKVYNDEYPGFHGTGFVWIQGSGNISFEIDVPETGMYRLESRCLMYLNNNGEGRLADAVVESGDYSKKYTVTIPYSEDYINVSFGDIKLLKGKNKISFGDGWGYCLYDSVMLTPTPDLDTKSVSFVPCDPGATNETKSLMGYLASVYGKNVLSGQQEIYGGGHSVQTTIRYDSEKNQCIDADGNIYSFKEDEKDTADDGSKFVWHCYDLEGREYSYNTQNRNYTFFYYDQEIDYIKDLTGYEPAVRGFDFGSNCPCYYWDDDVTKRMIDWAVNKNGICTASWHINVPTSKDSYTFGEPLAFEKTTYTQMTDFVTANVMKKGTMEYDYFGLCMENLAKQLLELQDAGVPVIFRPFHEAEGNGGKDGKGAWFWWSKEGTEVYKELWKYLYTTLTEKYGIHNLIWEQNLYSWSNESAEWYVGDDYADIVGFDKYDTQYNRHDGKTEGPNEDCNSNVFWALNEYVNGKKMVAMPENSTIPSVENMMVEKASWLYFCTWYDGGQDNFISGENYNNADTVKDTFKSEYCITREELPENLYSGFINKNHGSSDNDIQEKKWVYGDLNNDMSVELTDLTLLSVMLMEKKKPEGILKYSADADANGIVDIADLALLKQYISKDPKAVLGPRNK